MNIAPCIKCNSLLLSFFTSINTEHISFPLVHHYKCKICNTTFMKEDKGKEVISYVLNKSEEDFIDNCKRMQATEGGVLSFLAPHTAAYMKNNVLSAIIYNVQDRKITIISKDI